MGLGGALGPVWSRMTPRHCVWQAWHNLTSTFVLRGRRGTISHPPSFCVAGVALMGLGGALGPVWSRMTPRHFAWQAWHNLTSTFVLRGRRGTISHPPSFCVAGVALMGLGGALGPVWSRMTPRHCAWQAWHNLTSTFVSRGRRGTISHPPSFCVAGVALMGLGGALGPVWSRMTPRHFAWQAWHNLTSTFVSRGRRGTIPHPPSFCVAGVALGDIHLPFLRGRHGTWRHPPLFLSHTNTPSLTPLCHTPSLTHRHKPSLTHHLSYTALSHTIFHHTILHTPLCHTPSFTHRHKPSLTHHLSPHHLSHTNFVTHHLSHNFVTHQLCHTPSFTHHLSHTVTGHLSHIIFHTTLCLTPSFTTPSFTQICHAPTLSLTIFHTPSFTHRHRPSFTHHPSHTTLSHTIFHTQLCHTQLSHTPSFTQLCHTHTHTRHHLSLSHTSFHIQLCHTPFCFTSRSSTTSFVFPSFPIPATTFGAYYWRKLSCGVIRSFNW